MPVPAHTPTDPNVLTNGAHCYRTCIPKGLQAAVIIWLLDQWLKKKEPEPPVEQVQWEPESAVASWHDSGGDHTGDVSTFNATADYGSVTIFSIDGKGITSLTGLGLLANLQLFNCSINSLITIDISGNTQLTVIDCGGNQLTSLDASANHLLTELDCYQNQLGNLNITGDFAITTLDFSNNPGVVIIGP